MEPLRPAVEKLAQSLLRGLPAEERSLAAWPLACGSAVSARTRALSCIDGILRVEVPDANWSGRLAEFRRNYLHQLNVITGVMLNDILFIVGGSSPRRTYASGHSAKDSTP